MNPDDIESLLRKAPKPQPPSGLLQRLQADAHSPHVEAPQSWWSLASLWPFPRWAQATAAVVCILGAAGLLAMQRNEISHLRQENRQLLSGSLETPTQDSADTEAARLTRDLAELQRLRSEIALLRPQVAALGNLRAENERLRPDLGAGNGGPGSPPEIAQRKISIRCLNNLKNIALAARIYATDQEEQYPTSFLQFTNELQNPGLLHCPADQERAEASTWADLTPATTSYDYFWVADIETEANAVLVRCPIHDHVGLADGSVWQHLKQSGIQTVIKNGREYLVLPSASTNTPASLQ